MRLPARERQFRVVMPIAAGIGVAVAAMLIYIGILEWTHDHWPTATGTATSCSPEYRQRSSRSLSPPIVVGQSCAVRWQFDGSTHDGVVDLGATATAGDVVTLSVNGDAAVSQHSQSGGYVLGGFGVALLGLIVWATLIGPRRRHRVANRGQRGSHDLRPSTVDRERRVEP